GTFCSAARRCAAASESGLGSITVTEWPRLARGTANPPAPPPASTMSRQPRPGSAARDAATTSRPSRTTGVPPPLPPPPPPAAAVALPHRLLRSTVVSQPDISRIRAAAAEGRRRVTKLSPYRPFP